MRDAPSRTAEAVCLCRALDLRRAPDDRIVDDPLAPLFLGPASTAALAAVRASGPAGRVAERLSPGTVAFVLTRHRFIDDALIGAVERGIEQVLILGAGYDTRAWRFADLLGHRPVFEVDHPSTSARKAQCVARHRLEPRCVQVEVDFQRDRLESRLAAAGFEAGRRTFVVWEGVSMYLRRDAVKATLDALHALCGPGSELAMDAWFFHDAPDARSTLLRAAPNLLHLVGEPITFGIHPEDVGDFLARHGWSVADLATASELERRYVRDGRRVLPSIYVLRALRQPSGPGFGGSA